MSLKKTANSGISKKTFKKQFLTEKSLNEALQTRNDDKNSAEERRKHRYKPLQFSKQGSSKTSKLFTADLQRSKKTKNEVTIIPETDTEGEGEDRNQRKQMTMAERFQPKVILKDIINLCSDSDNNTWHCNFLSILYKIAFFSFTLLCTKFPLRICNSKIDIFVLNCYFLLFILQTSLSIDVWFEMNLDLGCYQQKAAFLLWFFKIRCHVQNIDII